MELAAVAGRLSILLDHDRPFFVVVDPSRAPSHFGSARVGRPVMVAHTQSTVMAMLECYEPSLIAWRVLSRTADAFMTVDDHDAISAMKRLTNPTDCDLAVVAGESGGGGLAALLNAASNSDLRAKIGLDPDARVFLINTEDATDPRIYEEPFGVTPAHVTSNALLKERSKSGANSG